MCMCGLLVLVIQETGSTNEPEISCTHQKHATQLNDRENPPLNFKPGALNKPWILLECLMSP